MGNVAQNEKSAKSECVSIRFNCFQATFDIFIEFLDLVNAALQKSSLITSIDVNGQTLYNEH